MNKQKKKREERDHYPRDNITIWVYIIPVFKIYMNFFKIETSYVYYFVTCSFT